MQTQLTLPTYRVELEDLPSKDYRQLEHRAQGFWMWHDWMLHNHAEPDGIYHIIPELAVFYDWDLEHTLEFAVYYGLSCVPAAWVLLNAPQDWHQVNFDLDRPIRQHIWPKVRQSLYDVRGDRPWRDFWNCGWDQRWSQATSIMSVGRVTAFMMLEAVSIAYHTHGEPFLDSPHLFLENTRESHVHGAALAQGIIDDPRTEVSRNRVSLSWFDRHTSNFQLESALCAYKQFWTGRRYPAYYIHWERKLTDWHKARWPKMDWTGFDHARDQIRPGILQSAPAQREFRDYGRLILP